MIPDYPRADISSLRKELEHWDCKSTVDNMVNVNDSWMEFKREIKSLELQLVPIKRKQVSNRPV